jgi:hypothetical protein
VPAILVVFVCAFLALGFMRRGSGLRQALIYSSVPVSLFIVFSTEALSVFHALTRAWIALIWFIFAAAAFLFSRAPNANQSAPFEPLKRWHDLNSTDRWMLASLTLIAGLVGLTALLSAPNTWDAMEYHMPRVVEWISNCGVQLYPTIDHQQLSMPPFSEYAILHLQLLFQSDRLANMVQWLAYVGCMLVASLIAGELGGDRRTQILAAVISGTIETGILGASGTKNDYTLTYWVATSVLLLLQWKRQQGWALTLAIASALSLSVFCKGTGYAFLPPLVVFCFSMWNWQAQKLFLLRLPVLALVCVMVSGPLWARNHEFSGSILGLPYFDGAGPDEGRMYGNRHITPTRSAANVLRNVALNLAVPVGKVNRITAKAFSVAIHALGVDPSDPSQLVLSQAGYLPPFNIDFRPFSETQAGNQLHFILLAAAGILCLWKRKEFKRDTILFAFGIAGSFVLYATLLRWSPWNARYQLPVFVLGAAFSAIVLVRITPRWTPAVAACLLLLGLALSVKNSSRPLVDRQYSVITSPRERTYFFDHHWDSADSFIQAAKAASGKTCDSIGIDANENHFEYPMMALLNRDGHPRTISYVGVHNSTIVYRQHSQPEPCTVVCLNCAFKAETERYQKEFKSTETFGDILVFSDPVPTGTISAFTPILPVMQKAQPFQP